MLAQKGAKVDARDKEDARPLHWAARAGHTAAIRALLTAGAAINSVTQAGATALHWAASAGWTDAAVALVLAGASLTVTDKAGRTPLDVAPPALRQAMMQAEKQRMGQRL